MSISPKRKRSRRKQKRSCRTKRKYKEYEAYNIASRRQSQGNYVVAYECPICKGWHVGKPFQEVRTEMAFNRLRKGRIKK